MQVRNTEDLKRILNLPRRSSDGDYSKLVRDLTELLRTEKGTMTLRPVQALALHDIGVNGGALLPIGVGEGKTLIFALAAYILDAKRPMGLLPAGLIQKTERELRILSQHWLIPTTLRLYSYDMLGRSSAADELDNYSPDAIICDEVHRLKNSGAACTRRVARYMAKNRSTSFVGMSGTIMRDSIRDFAPALFWALKEKAPLPLDPHELDEWSSAIEEPKASRYGEEIERTKPGALLSLCSPEELTKDEVTAVRSGFRRRLVETPGVVATGGKGEHVGASIRITGKTYKLKPVSDEHFARLRNAMVTPDGWELLNGVDVWRHAKELAIGFHSIWDPRPPSDWLDPRKRWGAFVRAILSGSRTLDSPEQVETAVLAGKIDDGGALADWAGVKETYTPNIVEIWHDDTVIKIVSDWAKKPGIVWTEHVFFAKRLAEETGMPYYGPQGLNAAGQYIEDSTAPTIIASTDANRDGKNLQHKWSRNLMVGPPDGWDAFQQCVARTHRPGQQADEVTVDVLLGCREHIKAWRGIEAGTVAAKDTIGGMPKLLLADVIFPDEFELSGLRGNMW